MTRCGAMGAILSGTNYPACGAAVVRYSFVGFKDLPVQILSVAEAHHDCDEAVSGLFQNCGLF
jgi:hypothetical protein